MMTAMRPVDEKAGWGVGCRWLFGREEVLWLIFWFRFLLLCMEFTGRSSSIFLFRIYDIFVNLEICT